jgi:hypothetical protein
MGGSQSQVQLLNSTVDGSGEADLGEVGCGRELVDVGGGRTLRMDGKMDMETAPWSSMVLFVAGDGDGGNHLFM